MKVKLGEQIMADFPKDWVNETIPFTYCGINLFGSFLVKERWIELERYGALFTCLVRKTVHIEVSTTVKIDSFMMALCKMG